MKKLFICLAGLFLSIPVYSNETQSVRPMHWYNFSSEFSHITYKEPSLDVKESGMMYGIAGEYDFRPDWDCKFVDVLHVDGHLNYGQVDYEGSGTINDIDNYMFEPRIWIGRDLNFAQSGRFTPYVGFGYRFLYDDLGGYTSSTGAAGYDRRSQYIYAPIGFQLASNVGQGWGLSINAEYDYFIRGWQDSFLSEFAGFPDIKNTQDQGYGLRGSIELSKKLDSMTVFVSPYVRFWHIEQSDTASATGSLFQVSGYEPENESLEVGARIGVKF